MMGAIFSNVVIAFPWMIGAFTALLLHDVLTKKGNPHPKDRLTPGVVTTSVLVSESMLPTTLITGAGGFIGYCVWGVVLLGANQFGFKPFQDQLIWALLFITLAATVIWYRAYKKTDLSSESNRRGIFIWVPSMLTLLLLSAIVGQTGVPVVAWDALHYWAVHAETFISSSMSGHLGVSFSGDLGHPPLVIILLAWSGWVSEHFGSSQVAAPWMLNGVSLVLITYGAAFLVLRNRIMSTFAALGALSLPLIEQHLSLAGYAEIWLCSGVLLSVSVLLHGFKENKPWMVFWGVLSTFVLPLIKNTGLLYASVIWAAVLFSLVLPVFANLARRRPLVVGLTSVLTSFLIVLLASAAINTCIETTCFTMGSYVLSADGFSVKEMMDNERYSLFMNQSFSVAGLIVVLGIWGVISHLGNKGVIHRDLIFVFSVTIFLLLIPVLTQLFLYDFWLGKLYASPSNDTGNSRLTIPFALVAVILAARLGLECESQDDVFDQAR